MRQRTFLTGLAAIAALSANAVAGVEVGDKAPLLDPKSLDNTNWKSLDPLKGKVVLYEFFAYW